MASYYPYVPPTLPRQYEAVSGRKLNYDPLMQGYIQGQIPGMEYATERGRLLDIDEAQEAERRREVEAELALREREITSAEALGEKELALSEEAARQTQRDQLLGLGLSGVGLGLSAYDIAERNKWFGLGDKGTEPTAQKAAETVTKRPDATRTYVADTGTTLPGAPSAGPTPSMLTGAGFGAGLGIKGAGYGFTPTSISAAELENPIWTEAGPAFTTKSAETAATQTEAATGLRKYAPYVGLGLSAYNVATEPTEPEGYWGAMGSGALIAGAPTGVGLMFAAPAMGKFILDEALGKDKKPHWVNLADNALTKNLGIPFEKLPYGSWGYQTYGSEVTPEQTLSSLLWQPESTRRDVLNQLSQNPNADPNTIAALEYSLTPEGSKQIGGAKVAAVNEKLPDWIPELTLGGFGG